MSVIGQIVTFRDKNGEEIGQCPVTRIGWHYLPAEYAVRLFDFHDPAALLTVMNGGATGLFHVSERGDITFKLAGLDEARQLVGHEAGTEVIMIVNATVLRGTQGEVSGEGSIEINDDCIEIIRDED